MAIFLALSVQAPGTKDNSIQYKAWSVKKTSYNVKMVKFPTYFCFFPTLIQSGTDFESNLDGYNIVGL